MATMLAGAVFFSTQFTSAPNASNWSVAGPPPQWFIPGTANSLVKDLAGIGILKEITGRNWGRVFRYDEYMTLLAEGT